MKTSNLLAKRKVNPRELMAHWFSSMRATFRPGTILQRLPDVLAPERRSVLLRYHKMERSVSNLAGSSARPRLLDVQQVLLRSLR